MKNIFFILLIFVVTCSFGQKAMTFDKARTGGVDMKQLDSTYMNAVNTDSTLAAFPDKQDLVLENWKTMLQEIGNYMKKNGIVWGEAGRCVNKVYFRSDGRIDYFLYNFRPSLDPEKEKKFDALLNEFIQTYNFGMTNKVNYSQCGTVSYKD